MNLQIHFLLIVAVFLFAFGCKNAENQNVSGSEATVSENETTSSEEISSPLLSDEEYAAMAQELCDCMKPLVDLQNKVNSLTPDEIRGMVDEIEKISQTGDKCVADLEAKYGKVEGRAAEEKADEAFKKACPYVAGMTNN